MKILNVTHGSFYAFGAYGAATAVGIYYDRGLPNAAGFLFMLLVAVGINVTVVFTVTFVLGAILGAIGGAVMAPKISVTLGIGVEVIVLAFAVVATGGMGSVEGALVGALIVGLARAAAVHLFPQIELFVIYAVMALVLVVRPYGLFTRAAPRKI